MNEYKCNNLFIKLYIKIFHILDIHLTAYSKLSKLPGCGGTHTPGSQDPGSQMVETEGS